MFFFSFAWKFFQETDSEPGRNADDAGGHVDLGSDPDIAGSEHALKQSSLSPFQQKLQEEKELRSV